MTPRTYQRRTRKRRLAWLGAPAGTKRKRRREFVMAVAEDMRRYFEARGRQG